MTEGKIRYDQINQDMIITKTEVGHIGVYLSKMGLIMCVCVYAHVSSVAVNQCTIHILKPPTDDI